MHLILVILIVLIAFFLCVMAIDCNRFVRREYACHSEKLQKNHTIVLLSDLHGKQFDKENRRLLSSIRKENPDLILIAGDMYTSKKHANTEEIATFVSSLTDICPVYYANGNHEQKTKLYPEVFGPIYANFADAIQKNGVHLLQNEKETLADDHIVISGLEMDRAYYGKPKKKKMADDYVASLLGNPENHMFQILIAHNPEYFEQYAAWGADLVVSGHVHGGLMKLPLLGGVISPRLVLFPKYDGGCFQIGSHTMILSRGLGTHTLPIRIFNPGELVVIHLDKVHASD